MSHWIFHLNDAVTTLADAHGVIAQSPGYAIVDARHLKIGRDAYAHSRANPRAVVTQFWSKFSTEPLASIGPRARTLADLAFAHLNELVSKGNERGGSLPTVFAVPGNFRKDQLGLLLGIAQQIPLQTVGLVDDAVVACRAFASQPHLLHIDLALHSAVLSLLRVEQGEIARQSTVELPNLGWLALQQQWVAAIADQFITTTRFDPLHQAHTEQQLYDGLEAWLAMLRLQGTIAIELEHKGKLHRINLADTTLIERINDRLDALMRSLAPWRELAPQVLITDFAQRAPGLRNRLMQEFGAVTVLDERSVSQGVFDQLSRITQRVEGQVQFTAQLPASLIAPTRTSSTKSAQSATHTGRQTGQPTHLLSGDALYSITDRLLHIGLPEGGGRFVPLDSANNIATEHTTTAAACSLARSGNKVTLIVADPDRVRLNDRPCVGAQVVKTGDELRVDAQQFRCVELIHGDTT